MKILIISGFLGAGKTTFIKELKKHTEKEFIIYENEYADAAVDTLLLKTDSLKVWESTENCICCTGKSDFASSVLTISNTIDPEFLVVEPTGVARLGNILSNISKVCYERIKILPPVTLADAVNFWDEKKNYSDVIENQIVSAPKVIITKSELATEEEKAKIVDEIRKLNKEAKIYPNGYKQLEKSWWDELLIGKNKSEETIAALPEKELETFSVNGNAKLASGNMLIYFLELLVRGAFGKVERAKGVLPCGEAQLRFDMVGKLWSITGCENADSVCAVIGEKLNRDLLRSFLIPSWKDSVKDLWLNKVNRTVAR